MHSSIYIIFTLGTQLLFLTQIIKALLIMDEAVDLLKTNYTNEKEFRLYSELGVLLRNINDTGLYCKKKLDAASSKTDLSDESSISKNRVKLLAEKINLMKHYQSKILEFINSSFESRFYLSQRWYEPYFYRQNNPSLDPGYPNWSYKFFNFQNKASTNNISSENF